MPGTEERLGSTFSGSLGTPAHEKSVYDVNSASILFALWLAAAPSGPPPGEYYSGDGLGMNWTFKVTDAGRFEFAWHGCLGLYDSNEGKLAVDGRWVTLAPEKPRDNGFARQLPLRWLYLRWGQRHYLIADDELSDFVRDVNDQSEPRSDAHGMHLLRDGDWKRRASGAPELPGEWASLLRPRPVSARVVAIEEGGIATLDRGTDAGMAVGLPLTVIAPGNKDPRLGSGLVIDATPSSARMRVTLGDKPRVGDLASTKAY